jgi:hypothetical protein
VAAEDDAERMTDGIGEDPAARLVLTSDPGGTQGEQFLLCVAGIAHANIEMRLLGIRLVRPVRGTHSVTRWKASWRRPGPEPMTTHPSMSSLILIPRTWQ